MGEVLNRVRVLIRNRVILAFYLALVAVGCTFPLFPLLNLPGYELAAALALLQGLLGGLLGLAAARVELRRDTPDLPRAVLAATVLLWVGLVPPFLLATALTLRTPCDPFATSAFFPVLTLPSAWVSAALGALVGTLTRKGWTAAVGWLTVIGLSAVHTTWPILFGPQIYAYSHLAGYLPGPLYDEELHLPTSLLWFRLATVALAVLVMAWLSRWPHRARWLLVSGAIVLGVELDGVSLGFRMSDAELITRLGGTRENAEVTLHYARELEPAEVDRIFEEVRFRRAQIARFLGGAPEGRVTVWWYASAEQKQRLVGALHTQFSKPWRREVHVNAAGFPHPVLKHELVHAMAGVWGAPPFGVTGLIPHAGIIEGLAVAADDPVDELRLHEWAAAMKKKGLLPDVAVLMEPQGFYSAPASRAYIAAGSFLRFLTEQHGAPATRTLYRNGDFQAAYGQPLATLAAEYEAFLAQVPLDEAAVNQAFGRFKRGSIFERPCAREVARLEEQAGGPAELALEIARRCRVLQPADPAHLLAQARALRRLARLEEAAALLDAGLPTPEEDLGVWAEGTLERCSLAHALGDERTERALLARLLEHQLSPSFERTARVRLAGLDLTEPRARAAVLRHLDPGNERSKTYFLRDADSEHWPVRYLLGRRLLQEGESADARWYLEATLGSEGVPEAVARETARLAIEAAWGSRDCATVRRLATTSRFGPGFEARARDWVERCDFLEGSLNP